MPVILSHFPPLWVNRVNTPIEMRVAHSLGIGGEMDGQAAYLNHQHREVEWSSLWFSAP